MITCAPGGTGPESLNFLAGLFLGAFGLSISQATAAVRRMETGESVVIGSWDRDVAETKAVQVMKRAEVAGVDVHVESQPVEAKSLPGG